MEGGEECVGVWRGGGPGGLAGGKQRQCCHRRRGSDNEIDFFLRYAGNRPTTLPTQHSLSLQNTKDASIIFFIYF